MENASKALIIAGAILLAILLISLGIFIFTGAQDTAKKSGGLEAQEVATFNAAIVKYEGKGKSASEIRAIKNEAIAANKKLISNGNAGNNNENLIHIQATGTASVLASEFNTSMLDDSSSKYIIKLGYNNTTGLVNLINISISTE